VTKHPINGYEYGDDMIKKLAALTGLVLAIIHFPAYGSYAIYVGKNLTTDGSVFIGGSGDEVSSHWLEIVPALIFA
jgi:hypothetical protein